MDFLAFMKMMGGTGGGGGGPMEMLSSLFGGGDKGLPKQDAAQLPQASPAPNLLPQALPQGLDTERLRRAVANRPTLGMMR